MVNVSIARGESDMRIEFAHIRERAAAGGWIDFAVFDAKSTTGTDADNARLLHQLAMAAAGSGLKIDQSALAFNSGGQIRFYGTPPLVAYLARSGVPRWTHYVDV
jgi:hypothetical protein